MLCLKNIIKEYGDSDNKVVALKGVSLDFRKSDFVSILGPSGCGKTTLLNIIGGLDHYTSGDLIINGTSTKQYKDRDWDTYRNHSVGFVFQTYNLIPHQTVLKNVELALTLSGVNKAERKERAKKALEEVGLGDKINKRPNQLSGGQMQRVAIARALVNNPEIILADEPTGALDTETSVQVMEILKNVSKDRLVIMVTHNPDLAEKYSSRIIRMLDGNIIGDTSPYVSETQVKTAETVKREKTVKKVKKPTMSFWTAFNLSLKNLFTKKGRTILTSFAGSIGIIGIALILAVSEGMTGYINHIQETTLSSYPLVIEDTSIDLTSLMESFMNVGNKKTDHDKDAIYKDPVISELVNALGNTTTNENDLKSFKKFLLDEINTDGSKLSTAISGLQYTYNFDFTVYTKNVDGQIIKSDTGELMRKMISDYMIGVAASGGGSESSSSDSDSTGSGAMSMMSFDGGGIWQEMLPGLKDGEVINKAILDQYELIDGGSWPNEKDEVVLIVNEKNELDDLTLFALGLLKQEDIDKIIDSAVKGEQLPEEIQKWEYSEIRERTYKTILPYDRYVQLGNVWGDVSQNDFYLTGLYENALELKVTGVIRPKENADATMLSSGIGYTSLLTEYIIKNAEQSAVYQAQKENPTVDIFTGKPFNSNTGSLSNEEKKTAFIEYVSNMNTQMKAQIYTKTICVDTEQEQLAIQTDAILNSYTDKDVLVNMIAESIVQQMGGTTEQVAAIFEKTTLDELKTLMRPSIEEMVKLNIADTVEKQLQTNGVTEEMRAGLLAGILNTLTDEKGALYYDEITEFSNSSYEDNLIKMGYLDIDSPSAINIYSSSFKSKDVIKDEIERYNSGVESDSSKINYTDYIGLMMSSVTQIVDAVTYVLIAFVSISLIVSSIMIGVITLISVQERTKEIGILRAIGASKKDVSSMFNAETLIIGFTSGLFGVLITYLLCIPINIILYVLTGIANLRAVLPIGGAIILVLISMLLTLVAGIIPSRSASKKDPVVALRTE